jgi:hypothetical protein
MGKKYREINLIKNPQEQQDLTFVSDPVKKLLLSSNQQVNNGTTINDDNNKKMVKKARHDSRFSKNMLRNKSKQGLSKQTHSPVYE